jgi:hypothetical protein
MATGVGITGSLEATVDALMATAMGIAGAITRAAGMAGITRAITAMAGGRIRIAIAGASLGVGLGVGVGMHLITWLPSST